MKKLFSIALLSLYLLSATELNQLLKLPVLVEHYAEHSLENKSLSFWNFLCMHYSDQAAQHDQDERLPFKSHEVSVVSASFLAVTNHYSISEPVYSEIQQFAVYNEFITGREHSASVWQPPKFC